MDWILALVLIVGLYHILQLYFTHRETMAKLLQSEHHDDCEYEDDEDDEEE